MPNAIWKALTNANRASEIIRCTAETRQWPSVSAAYLSLSRLQYPYLLRLHHGEQIRIEELTDLKAFWQIFLRRVYRVQADAVTLKSTPVRPYPGKLNLYRAKDVPDRMESDSTLGWGSVAGEGVKVDFVPGDHVSMFKMPNVANLAGRLQREMQNCEGAPRA